MGGLIRHLSAYQVRTTQLVLDYSPLVLLLGYLQPI